MASSLVLAAALLITASLGFADAGVLDSDRIYHGSQASPQEFPYQVSLQTYQRLLFWHVSSHYCGGTLLSERWVMTAAHCTKLPGQTVRAVVGTVDLKDTSSSNVQWVMVDRWIRNENFDKHANAQEVGPYDIGLAHLEKAVVFTDYVKPAKLPASGVIPTGEATVSGWGDVNDGNFPSPRYLQYVTEPLLDLQTCNASVAARYANTWGKDPLVDTNVCTSPGDSKVTACQGDSGGPLVQKDASNDTVVIGIVSFGFMPCGRYSDPTVYTRVSAYIDWLSENMSG